jgi:hypothetical protein
MPEAIWRVRDIKVDGREAPIRAATVRERMPAAVDRTVSVEGNVDEFLLRNPHSFVRAEVANQTRRIEMWLMEWSSGGQLGRAGVSKDTLKPGDHVIVTGNPSRSPEEHKLHVVTIVRPADGWRWNADRE